MYRCRRRGIEADFAESMSTVAQSKPGASRRSKRRPRTHSNTSPAGIVRDLASDDAARRRGARAKATERGSRVAPALIKALDSTDENLRWDAVDLLGAIGDTRATAGVTACVLSDDDVHVRWRAIWASTALDDGTVVPKLVSALKDRNATVVWNAAVALSVFGRPDGVPKLHAGLKSRILFQRWEAANALGSVHDRRTQRALVRALERDVSDVRREAALSLGRIGSPTAAPALVKALQRDADPEVRWRAAMSLGRLGDAGVVGSLRKLLKKERSEEVRAHLEQAIRDLTKSSTPQIQRSSKRFGGGS